MPTRNVKPNEYDARLANLRDALEEGEASGDADDYSLETLIAAFDREKAP
jgi:hypothetical protein